MRSTEIADLAVAGDQQPGEGGQLGEEFEVIDKQREIADA